MISAVSCFLFYPFFLLLLSLVQMPIPTALAQQQQVPILPNVQQTKKSPVVSHQEQLAKAENVFPLGQLPTLAGQEAAPSSNGQQASGGNSFTYGGTNANEFGGAAKRVAELPQAPSSNVGGSKKSAGIRRPELFGGPRDQMIPERVRLSIRLRRYTNPRRRMQNSTTCACPQSQQDEGNCGKNSGNHSPCYTKFTAVVGAADQVVDFRSTNFIVVDESGTIDALREPAWGEKMEFLLPSKPQFVDIYAYNLGPVFHLDGRILSWSDTVWPVDAWTLDLDGVVPYGWTEPPFPMSPLEAFGRYDTGTNLNLEYSVQCLNNFMGPKCDLKCSQGSAGSLPDSVRLHGGANRVTTELKQSQQQTSANNNADRLWTICESDLEPKRFFECHFRNNLRQQVDSCKFCEFGLINDTVCVHDSNQWRQEQFQADFYFYRDFTIVLAIAFGITLLLLILTCICCWIFGPRQSSKRRRESAPLGTYRRGAGAPYNISDNGFVSNTARLGDPLTHPLLLTSNSVGLKQANGHLTASSADWSKPAQPPVAIQRGILLHQPHQHQQQYPAMLGGGHVSPTARQQMMGSGESGGGPMGASSPNTSESDFRPSPFTPRREAQV